MSTSGFPDHISNNPSLEVQFFLFSFIIHRKSNDGLIKGSWKPPDALYNYRRDLALLNRKRVLSCKFDVKLGGRFMAKYQWKWFKKAIFPCLYLVNLSTQGNDCSLITFIRCGAAERAGLALEKEPFNSILPLFYSSLSLSVWVCFELVVYEVFIAIFFSIATLINSILSLLYSSLSLSVKVCCELVVYEVIIAVFFPITTSFPHRLAFGSHREYSKCHRSLRTPWSTLLEFSKLRCEFKQLRWKADAQ